MDAATLSIVALLVSTPLCHGVTSIPRIFLFSQAEFGGTTFALALYPGCNNIWAFGWDKNTASIVKKNECIILYDRMNCQGRGVQVTRQNEGDLRNLAGIGFVHRYDSGLSSVAKCESEVCTALGTFIKPGYCDKYFRCSDEERSGIFTKKNFRCPEKLQFDPKLGHCTKPEKILPKVSCDYNATTTT